MKAEDRQILDRTGPDGASPEERTRVGATRSRCEAGRSWRSSGGVVGSSLTALLVGVGTVAALEKVVLHAAGVTEATPEGLVVVVPALLVSLWVALAVHELGHVLGGRLGGLRFHLFVAGPLRVVAEGGGIRIGLNRNLALAGGAALAVAQDARQLRQRFALAVAGGPVLSLVVGGAAGVAWLDTPYPPLVHLCLGVLGVLSAALGVVTLIPNSFGGLASDGTRLSRLIFSNARGERDAAVLALSALSAANVSPRNWDQAVVQLAVSQDDGGWDEAIGRLLAFRHAIETGDAAAEKHLARALVLADALPPAYRPLLYLEAAYFEAAHRNNVPAARRHLATARPSPLVGHEYRARAEEAITAAERRQAAIDQNG